MDSAEFLDLLGNDNRRRILKLLSQKPCYVTEISEYLGVSPKAVIDHLERLESAGLVEHRTDEQRRKYFSISRHVRLEVTVSPYKFGTQSAYPTNSRFDVSSCRRVQLSLEPPADTDPNNQADDDRTEEQATDTNPAAAAESVTQAEKLQSKRAAGKNPEGDIGEDQSPESEHGGGQHTGAEGTADNRPENVSLEEATSQSKSPDTESSTDEGQTAQNTPIDPDGLQGTPDRSAGAALSSDPTNNEEEPTGEVASLAHRLREFEQLDRELSLVHRWAEGRLAAFRRELIETVPVGDPRLVSELLVDLAAEPRDTETLYRRLEAPPEVIEDHLDALANEGLVSRDGRTWHLNRDR